jgi:hypothetical protein
MMGDVNSSDSIDIVDALLVAQCYVGFNPLQFEVANADVDADAGEARYKWFSVREVKAGN